MKLSDLKPSHSYLDEVLLVQPDLVKYQILREGKLIPGRFPLNIRIDKATHLHGNADPHAHVFGRKGGELGIVKLNGAGSHGSKFKLHDKDAAALRLKGSSSPLTTSSNGSCLATQKGCFWSSGVSAKTLQSVEHGYIP